MSGQIRRVTTLQTGDLTYIQSDGIVSVYSYHRDSEFNGSGYTELNTLNKRAIFEVCNNGAFITSGGELRIMDNGKGESWGEYGFGDILITPASGNVTGGTIVVGSNAATPNQEFSFNSSLNLYNLTIGTETSGQKVKLHVNPLNLQGTLTINNGSTLEAVGHDVFVKKDIFDYSTNGYSAISGQCLTLNGTSLQRIVGSGDNTIRVDKITFTNPTKVELSGINIDANNYLYIERGTVDDGGNKIIAKSDVINDAVHISSVDGGGIFMEGALQTLRSTSGHIGNYGNLIIKSQTTVGDNIRVNGLLTLNNVLDLGGEQLIMGPEADFAGPYNSSSMIQLTGAIGDLGVKRLLPNNPSVPLFFPIGRSGIYSPAQYSFSSLSGSDAYIVVKVIGYRHKSLKEEPHGSVDAYWMVSSGGIGSCTVTHTYYYCSDDLKAGTDEALMLPKRYDASENEWTNYDTDEGSVADNAITISNLSYIDGEYTAGYYGYSCQPPMRSITDGLWEETSTWEQLNDKEHDIWGPAESYPNGNPVTITAGTEVNVTTSSLAAYSVNIEDGATLNIGKTSKHNFGRLSGSGTIKLTALDAVGDVQSTFKLPAGDYDEFLADANSTIIFNNGDHNAWLSEQPGNYYKPFSNVQFTGNGQITVTAQSFYARGNVTIESGCQIDNATNNRSFYLGGDYTDNNSGSTGYISGTSKVIFCGTDAQTATLGCDANFYDMEINNGAGLALAGSNISLRNRLYLTDGVIYTAENSLIKLASTSSNVVTGGSASSHIDGPLSKNILNSGSFMFPVGNDGRYGRITISNTAGSGYWTAQHINSDPSVIDDHYSSPIVAICDNEYWKVSRPAGATAKIGLHWDSEATPYTNLDMLKSRMQVVEYGNDVWAVRESTADGTLASGTITTKANVTYDDYIFTFGFTGVVAEITNTDPLEICGDGEDVAVVNVSLSGTAPWTLTYQISDGTSTSTKTLSGILSPSYNLSFVSADLGGEGTYTISVLGVSDATEDGVSYGDPATIIVKKTYIPTITGPQAVVRDETRQYSVEYHDHSSYTWEFPSGGTIINGQGTNSISIRFGTNNSNYTLSVTEKSIDNCSIKTSITITVSNNPAPVFEANLNVCVDDELTYSTENADGHNYQWKLDEANIGTNSSSVKIKWTEEYAGATHKLEVTESKRIGGRTYTGTHYEYITVHAKPNVQEIGTIAEICAGNKPVVHLNNSQTGVSYYLYSGTNAISRLESGTGHGIDLTTLNPLNENVETYIIATNLGCNFEQDNYQRIPSDEETKTIVVNENPAIAYTMPELYVNAPSYLVYRVTSVVSPNHYSIEYTHGGDNLDDDLPGDIVFFPKTDDYITGTLTIKSAKNCHSDYPIDAPVSDGYVWAGTENDEWDRADNWYSNAVPSSEHGAVIRSAPHQPVISSTANAKSVKIESDGELTISGSNILNVYGDWKNMVGNDGFNAGESTVKFNNNAEMSGNTTFNNIGIGSNKAVTISSGYITVNGNVANSGTLNGSEGSALEMAGTTDTRLEGGTYNLANLKINKTSGNVEANTALKVGGEFAIVGGVLNMNGNILELGASATTSFDEDNKYAYVDGVMSKTGSTPVVFPIGNNRRRAMVGIEPVGANSSTKFTAGYIYTPKDPDAELPAPDPMDAELVRVSKMDNWNISVNNGASAYVTLYWDDGEISEITKLESLTIAHWNGSKWEMLAANATGDPASGRIRTVSPVTSFSPFTFGSTDVNENPLPVEIVNFIGHQSGNTVVLEWTTLSEKDNDFFEIERSTDGVNFETIGFVQGAGNSTEKIAYSFADNAPESGLAYYRLSQVDYDGTRSYADKVISIAYITGNISLTVVPNPTTGQFQVRIIGATDGSAKLMTQSGTVLRIIDINGPAESINISDLPSGIYILQYQTGTDVVHERIVKL